MNQASSIIKKRDFEKYEIVIPFSSILGKRKKQYLCSELEKLHPCFSDEYIFDSFFKKFCRKGLFSDVYVMSKYKLAEYEGQRHFSGSGFLVEKGPGNKVERRFHHIFVDKKWRWIMWLSLWCALVGLAGAVSGSMAGSRYYKSLNKTNNPELDNNSFSENEIEEYVPDKLREISLVEKLLLIVEKSAGKISDFEWHIDGYSEKLNVSITGVFPEELQELEVQTNTKNNVSNNYSNRETVVYKKGIPAISVSYNCSVTDYSPAVKVQYKESVLENSGNSDLFKTIREVIIESGGELLEENISPYKLSFLCRERGNGAGIDGGEDVLKSIFQSISKILKTGGMSVSFIKIMPLGNMSVSGAEEFKIIFSAEKLPFSVLDLQLLSNKTELFYDERKTDIFPVSDKYLAETKQTENVIEKSDRGEVSFKLGEIRKPDKSVVTFYKNMEGKILKRIEFEESY